MTCTHPRCDGPGIGGASRTRKGRWRFRQMAAASLWVAALAILVPIYHRWAGRAAVAACLAQSDAAGLRRLRREGVNLGEWGSCRYWTPLHVAAQAGDNELVQYLLGRGLDVDAGLDQGNQAPLQVAIACGKYNVVPSLLRGGANPHPYAATFGMSTLERAVTDGRIDAVASMLRAGADPNRMVTGPHAYDVRPLLLAIRRDRADMASLLLAFGATTWPRVVFLRLGFGNTDPLWLAKQYSPRCVPLIREARRRPHSRAAHLNPAADE